MTSLQLTNILNEIEFDMLNYFENLHEIDSSILDINKYKSHITGKLSLKIQIIKTLNTNNLINETILPIDSICNTLKGLICNDTINNSVKYYKTISKKLGYIIFDIYRNSGYHILLSNIPVFALLSKNINNRMQIIDEESIYDTLEEYTGLDSIIKVIKVSPSNYLVKFKEYSKLQNLCSLLNNMQIADNIIKVELIIENIEDSIEDSNTILENISIPIVNDININANNVNENDNEKTIEKELQTNFQKEFKPLLVLDDKVDVGKDSSNDRNDTNYEDLAVSPVSHGNLLIVDLVSGIYNKISGAFRFITGR